MATSRPSRVSCARYTSPMPPAPIGRGFRRGRAGAPASSSGDSASSPPTAGRRTRRPPSRTDRYRRLAQQRRQGDPSSGSFSADRVEKRLAGLRGLLEGFGEQAVELVLAIHAAGYVHGPEKGFGPVRGATERPSPMGVRVAAPPQPGLGTKPLPLHRARRNSQGVSGFRLTVAGEEAALDHLQQPRLCASSRVRSSSSTSSSSTWRLNGDLPPVEGSPADASASFLALSLSRVVDHHLPHRGAAIGKEMLAILPVDAGLIDQLQVRLVDEAAGVQAPPVRQRPSCRRAMRRTPG